MVIYKVLSEQIPFHQYATLVTPGKVVKGDCPKRPQGVEGIWFMNDVWEVLGRCWTPQPGNHPSIEDVLQCLKKASGFWTPPSPWLLAASPTPGSLTPEFSDITTLENADRILVSSPSQVSLLQPSGKLELDESAGIVNVVGQTSFSDKFHY